MSRFAKALFACIIATSIAGALIPERAEAARLTKAEKAALKSAIVACKAEAKGKKVRWLARRKYVNHCVIEALKDHPNIDIRQLLRDHPNLQNLTAEHWDAF